MDKCHIHNRPIRPCRTIAKSSLPVRPAVPDRLIQDVEPHFGNRHIRSRRHLPRPMNFQNARNAAHGRRVAKPKLCISTAEPRARSPAFRSSLFVFRSLPSASSPPCLLRQFRMPSPLFQQHPDRVNDPRRADAEHPADRRRPARPDRRLIDQVVLRPQPDDVQHRA